MFHCLIFGNVSETYGFPISRSPGIYRITHTLRNLGWDAESVDFFNSWSLEELKHEFFRC